jgi:putative transposase
VQVQPASVKDRDGAPSVVKASRARFPFVRKVFADSAYAGEKVANATTIAVEIVRKLADQVGFRDLPRRWVVERFFDRRLAKDFEATITSATAFLYAACVMLLTRRFARSA